VSELIRDEAEKDALIKEELDTISDAYRNVEHAADGSLDYSDPVKRFAYIYKYTVAHADYIMQLVERTEELASLFERKEIEVACLGGGPGSDLLGILKYILNNSRSTTLTCYLFDRERAWSDAWVHVARRMDAPCKVFPVFNQMDVTDQKTWAAYESFFESDIITLSYFLSEVYRHRTEAEPFFEHVFLRAKSGAAFLYIDNWSAKFTDWFDGMTTRAGLETISQGTRTIAFSNDEEKSDLGPYLAKFDWPKRKADVAFRIMRKP
jgi:hypothetical protein